MMGLGGLLRTPRRTGFTCLAPVLFRDEPGAERWRSSDPLRLEQFVNKKLLFSLLLLATSLCAMAAPAPTPTPAPHQPKVCLLGIDWEWTPGWVAKLWDVSMTTGAVSNPRPTGLGHTLDIAINPSNTQLYAVTTVGGSPVQNALYQVDIATGASTLVGPLGIGTLFEGDLAFSDNGTLYGIFSSKLFTINLTTGAATLVGNPNGSDYSYLSFNGSGTLFGIDNSSTPGQVPTYLDQLNPNTAAVLASQQLTPALGGYGGMDWYQLGGYMWVADGKDPGSVYAGHRKLFKLDTTTGVLTVVGNLGLSHGLSGLAACKPCAVETALDAEPDGPPKDPSLAETLEMAYRVRDELLARTDAGRHYSELFYNHSLRMVYLMGVDSSLRHELADFLQAMTPGFLDLLDRGGKNVKVDGRMIAAARNLADRFAAADEGGDLAKAIGAELERLSLDRLEGMTFAEAWAYLNSLR
jgi:hypothetical protein